MIIDVNTVASGCRQKGERKCANSGPVRDEGESWHATATLHAKGAGWETKLKAGASVSANVSWLRRCIHEPAQVAAGREMPACVQFSMLSSARKVPVVSADVVGTACGVWRNTADGGLPECLDRETGGTSAATGWGST